MLFTNEIRLASCSAVALMMMSVPGLTNPSTPQVSQPVTATPTPVLAPVATTPAKKKKFSFLHRPSLTGLASWYGAVLNGHKTASGETFDMNQMTACHRTLPFGTMVKVVDTKSGKSVIVRINDRGVLFADRVIDLSRGAAEKLGIRKQGVASVRLEVLTKKQAAIEISAAKAAEPLVAESTVPAIQ